MIRWIGALCVVFATTYAGIEYSRNMQRRILQLNALKQIMVQLYGDVEYGGCPLAESFQRIAAKQELPFKNLLMYLCKHMEKEKNRPLEAIFKTAIGDTLNMSALEKKDKESLLRFGNQLGNGQRNNQLRTIQLYIQELEHLISELEKEKSEKQKLSRVLGISSGLLIVILLL